MSTQYTYDEDCYSDLHKDVYGFRPREGNWTSWVAMTPDEKQAQWDYLIQELGRVCEEEKAREHECIVLFEERIANTIKNGAADRETAIRWLMDAEDAMGDPEYMCFLVGIPYGYFKKTA